MAPPTTGCPRCGEPAPTGTTCGGCGRVHHAECARAFGRCGACQASLDPQGRGPGADLPRLQALARRVGAFDPATLPPADGPLAVCLVPAPERRADPRAAEAVGSVLGTSVADGAQRVGSPVPEPLVRVPDAASAAAVERALRDVGGVEAFSLPLGELLAPLLAFEAEQVELGTTTTYRDAQGATRSHRFGEPRLVVTAPFLLAARRQGGGPIPAGTPRLTPTRATLRLGRKTPEAAAFVFMGADPVPVLLRETGVRDWSCLSTKMTMVPAQNLEALARELGQGGGELRALPRELGQDPWMVRLGARDDQRENAPLVGLAARLLHRRWLRARQG